MEIKPQELRIGNLICVDDEVASVTAIGKVSIYFTRTSGRRGSEHLTSVSGIELTPGWLERADFQIIDETMASGVEGITGPYYAKDALLLWSNGSEPKSAYLVFYADGFFGKYKAVRGRWIHTVHDLQNTYHAWKGEELAIDKQLSNGN